jgi:hypothetical protein
MITILKGCAKVVSRIQSERLRDQLPPSQHTLARNNDIGQASAVSGTSVRQDPEQVLGGDHYCNVGSAEILSEFLNHDPFLNLAMDNIIWNSDGSTSSLWVNANEWKDLI